MWYCYIVMISSHCVGERECRELEEYFGLNLTDHILSRSACSAKETKNVVYEQDKIKRAQRCLEKAPLIAKVAEHAGWAQLSDAVLDLGWKAVKGLQMLSRAMSHHGRGSHPCHLCDAGPLLEASLLKHILGTHWKQLHMDSVLDYKSLQNNLNNFHLDILAKL